MPTPTIKAIGRTISEWGEGPVWAGSRLYYVDIKGHKLIRIDPDSGIEEQWDMGEQIGTVTLTHRDNEVIYAGSSGYVRFNLETREKARLADPEADLRKTNRFNDGKCDPAGRFWAGTISMTKEEGTANLYCLETKGSCVLKLSKLTNSNGICWSPDSKIMYHIDTPKLAVHSYDYNIIKAEICNPRVAIDTKMHGYESSPDGMTIDSEGMLWVAFCHGGCVVRFDPLENKELQRIDLPCIETTSCTFGGDNLDRLFVTTGIKPNLVEADAGKIFVVDGLGVKGIPAFTCGV
jgi:sugar lactone lactonase YvrE